MNCESMSTPCDLCASPRGRGHVWSCLLWLVGELTMILGLITLVAAWVTNYYGTTFLSFDAEHLFHDAIALLILCLIFSKKAQMRKEKLWLNSYDESLEEETCIECGEESCNDSKADYDEVCDADIIIKDKQCCGRGECGDKKNGACCEEGECACEKELKAKK